MDELFPKISPTMHGDPFNYIFIKKHKGTWTTKTKPHGAGLVATRPCAQITKWMEGSSCMILGWNSIMLGPCFSKS